MPDKTTIDNLTDESTASEMEQAILDSESKADQVEEKVEVKEEIKEEVKEEQLPEAVEPEAPSDEETVEEKEQPKEKTDTFDYKKGYQESVKWNTQNSQKIADLGREITELRALGQPKQPEAKPPTATMEQWQEAYDRDPVNTSRLLAKYEATQVNESIQKDIGAIKAVLGRNLVKSTIDGFRADENYPGFREMETEIKEIVDAMPPEMNFNPKYFNQALDTAYWTVKGKRSISEAAKAKETGRRERQVKVRAKKEAYVEGSGKTTPEQPFDFESSSADEHFKQMKAMGIVSD